MSDAAGKLDVKLSGVGSTPRITYAAEQVRAACDEVSAGGSLQVSLHGAASLTARLWISPSGLPGPCQRTCVSLKGIRQVRPPQRQLNLARF